MSDETKCMSCGGPVDADGQHMSEGGEVESDDGEPGTPMPSANDSNPAEDDENVRDFVRALNNGKKAK